jgi:hypothetical protein
MDDVDGDGIPVIELEDWSLQLQKYFNSHLPNWLRKTTNYRIAPQLFLSLLAMASFDFAQSAGRLSAENAFRC